MPKVNVSEAAALVKKSRTTLYKKHINIDDGPQKLQVTLDENGDPEIDTDELIRVFGKLHKAPTDSETQRVIDTLRNENTHLLAILQEKQMMIQALQETVTFAKAQTDIANEMNRRLLPGEIHPPAFVKWFQSLFR